MKRKYSYSDIKLAYFEAALDYCKFHFNDGIIESWDYNGSEYGFAQDNMPEFKHPLEQLMFRVIVAIENAGRYVPTHISILENINKSLIEYPLETLIADLTPEERQYEDEGIGFLCDLNLVLNNQKLERE